MTTAIGTYIRLLNTNGSDTGYRFQNFFQGSARVYDGQTYTYSGFGFTGGTLDLEAANISASLVFPANELSLAVFTQAVNDRWLVKLRTVWLDPDTLTETALYSQETYAVTGLEHDNSRMSIRVGSPLDAVRENAPRRSLTQKLVGSLPTTGEINLQ